MRVVVALLLVLAPLLVVPTASAGCAVGPGGLNDVENCVFNAAGNVLTLALSTCTIHQDIAASPPVVLVGAGYVPTLSFIAEGGSCVFHHATCSLGVVGGGSVPATCTFPGACESATNLVCHPRIVAGSTVGVAVGVPTTVQASFDVTGATSATVGAQTAVRTS